MKKLLQKLNLLLCVLFFLGQIFNSNAQETLKADAGENQHFCFATDWLQTTLGGNPTASGGVPPYTYRWWTTNNIFLSDEEQVKSNPEVIFLGGFTAYLEVTDAVENTDIDSVVITMSNQQLNFSNDPQYLQIDYYVNSGDSIFLNGNVLALNPASKFSWSPCESIVSDCHVSDGFWAKPNTTTYYHLTAIDEHNCSETFFTHFYRVYVDEVGIKKDDSEYTVEVYPNPATDYLKIKNIEELNLSNYEIEVFDIYGRKVATKFPSNELEGWQPQADGVVFNISHLQAGIYFVKITTEKGIFVEKIIKN